MSRAARLTAEEAKELRRIVERYGTLPDASTASLLEDIARVEAITSAVYERSKLTTDIGSEEDQQLLDRAESLLPLMKVCMPGSH